MRAIVFSLVLAACAASGMAFTIPPHSSSFSTRARLNAATVSTPRRRGVAGVEMKRKGKPNVPINQRGGYQQKMQQDAMYRQQKEMMESGMPSFRIFARTKLNNMWYPCGQMMGDEKSKATVDALMGGFLSGVSKYSLERGVATSVLNGKADLVRQVVQAYPQLKNENLTFGYKIEYKGLEEKMGKQQIKDITSDMTMGPLDKMKNMIGFK